METPYWKKRTLARAQTREAVAGGRAIWSRTGIDFCSNDYLGLRQDARLIEASTEATRRFGAGMGAARLLGGNTSMHQALEEALAAWKQSDQCLLFNSGFQANSSMLPALTQVGDVIFSDQFNHASIIDGCNLAKAKGVLIHKFDHLDYQKLEEAIIAWGKVRQSGQLGIIISDTVFSMDGDCANLHRLISLSQKHDLLLILDEAHATGLLGGTGAGLAESEGVLKDIPLTVGTLGKSFGSYGAYICGESSLIQELLNSSRGFIFSTALPPGVIAAAQIALDIIQQERFRATRALGYAQHLRSSLSLPLMESAIVPIIIGDNHQTMQDFRRLREMGFDIGAIRPPTVPSSSSRLRITLGAHLHQHEVNLLIEQLRILYEPKLCV